MVSGTDYSNRYGQAKTAYLEGDLAGASQIIESMSQDYPEDPSILLLKGHIYLSQQNYDSAKKVYNSVLELTDHEELVNLAHQGLEQIRQVEEESLEEDELDEFDNFNPEELEQLDLANDIADEIEEVQYDEESDDWTNSIQFDNIDWDASELEDEDLEDPTLQSNKPLENPLASDSPLLASEQETRELINYQDAFSDDENSQQDRELSQTVDFNQERATVESEVGIPDLEGEDEGDNFKSEDLPENVAPTFVVSSDVEADVEAEESELSDLEKILTSTGNEFLEDFDYEEGDYSSDLEPLSASLEQEFSGVIAEERAGSFLPEEGENFFSAPEDLDDIPDIEASELPVSSIFTQGQKEQERFSPRSADLEGEENELTGAFELDTNFSNLSNVTIDDRQEDSLAISGIASIPSNLSLAPEVEVSQGFLGFFYNLSLSNKQLVSAGVTAAVTFMAIWFIGILNAEFTPQGQAERITYPWYKRALLSLVAGAVSGGTALGIGQLVTNHAKRYTRDLQSEFESVAQGNYEVRATIYSEDEWGELAAGFNRMAKMINSSTTEAKKRAEETEKAREDLQRQVIRLLDDVEGAARGDLTVQAEVTADVLGAVADAFNLTITNLREIVKQVKQAAVQVNKGSTDSELFARNQSSDALRMAEELAVTLNSVQMMTDSIQRVAENAREAEEVARSSSVTALKGGDAVERTVAGILQIRETVSETTRKVKRLAEASQQISTIVAIISQISSRTNLLALNASIQAARAGEAGRGFAIVADEVRQLADRSAKSLQEIEQIVLQIQTETGSVMTAMEEGIQQVLDVTERSEQAKRSLEDIIQVSNRIDALVRSITADTVEQRENSRAVAKVMQAVELTAQATSQESQRVAGSLQNLVRIAKNLIASVERFKVE